MFVPHFEVNNVEKDFFINIKFLLNSIVEIIHSCDYVRLLYDDIVNYSLLLFRFATVLIVYLALILQIPNIWKKLIDINLELIHELLKSYLSFWIWRFSQAFGFGVNFLIWSRTMRWLTFFFCYNCRLSPLLWFVIFWSFGVFLVFKNVFWMFKISMKILTFTITINLKLLIALLVIIFLCASKLFTAILYRN